MEKVLHITYSDSMSMALIVHHANSIHHIKWSSVPVWLCHVGTRYLINGTIFGKKD